MPDKNEREANQIWARPHKTAEEWDRLISLLTMLAKLNKDLYQEKLACCYHFGDGIEKDLQQAIYWYRKAALRGNSEALFGLGEVYYEMGHGTDKTNTKKCIRYELKAAEMGHVFAQANVGMFYLEGKGVKRSLDKGLFWTRSAAMAGSHVALYNLGVYYKDVEGKMPEAVQLFRKAAKKGNNLALFELGIAYIEGEGVRKNVKRGIDYLELAASRGSKDANTHLGMLYHNGEVVTQDLGKAISYYRAAANLNDTWAKYFLGLCFLDGDGVKKNRRTAIKWIAAAAQEGLKEAREEILAINK